jgi:hypothetical protein
VIASRSGSDRGAELHFSTGPGSFFRLDPLVTTPPPARLSPRSCECSICPRVALHPQTLRGPPWQRNGEMRRDGLSDLLGAEQVVEQRCPTDRPTSPPARYNWENDARGLHHHGLFTCVSHVAVSFKTFPRADSVQSWRTYTFPSHPPSPPTNPSRPPSHHVLILSRHAGRLARYQLCPGRIHFHRRRRTAHPG